MASMIKENILRESKSDISSISDNLFMDQIRSKKLDALDLAQ